MGRMVVTGDSGRAGRRLRVTLLLALALLAFGAVQAASAAASGTVTVTVAGQGSATGPGINCTQSGGPGCSASYPDQEVCEFDPETRQQICYFEPQTVEVVAGSDANGYAYQGWTGCDSVSGRTCSVAVTENKSLRVSFNDVQAPSVGSVSPSGGVQRGTITLGATASDNSGAVDRIEFRVRGQLVGIDTTPAPQYTATFDTASMADGTAVIRATAIDDAGLSGYSESAITIDNTPPTLNITSGPNGQTYGPGTTQTWTFSASDGTSGLASVQCSVVPAGAPASYGACSGSASHSVGNRPDGSYTLSVRARDSGGLETVQTRSFNIDATPPDTTITGGPADGSSSTSTSATFSFASSETGSTFACRVFPAGITPPAFAACSGDGTHTAANLNPGTYTFQVVATDAYGNTDGSPASRTFTVSAPGSGGSTGGEGTPGGATGPGPLQPFISDAEIASLLAADLGAATKTLGRQRMSTLARRGSIALRVRALVTGRFALSFKGAATGARSARAIVIAKGARTVSGAGTHGITLKLTKAGRKLLRRGRLVRGKLALSFTRVGGATLARSKSLTLKRR